MQARHVRKTAAVLVATYALLVLEAQLRYTITRPELVGRIVGQNAARAHKARTQLPSTHWLHRSSPHGRASRSCASV